MSIFISIASYQDPLLVATIFSAYNNAEMKDALVFGVCDQAEEPIKVNEFPFANQIRHEHIYPLMAKGPCWARHRVQNFYQGEDYFLQIDSHTLFTQGWDKKLIDAFESIASHSRRDAYYLKPVITTYPRSFKVKDFAAGIFELNSGDQSTHIMTYMKDALFCQGSFSRQIGVPTQSNSITHAFVMAAGCIFTRGSFVKEVPYDPNYYFYGEELSMMLRAFTRGYSFFHVPDVPIFHLYTDVENLPRKLHWDPADELNRVTKWQELDRRSIQRLDDLVAKKLDGLMGLGSERTLEEYASFSGIDFPNKQVLDLQKATEPRFLESLDWEKNPIA